MAIIVVLTVLAFGALWLSYLYVAQESLIYYPSGYSGSELENASRRCDRVDFETAAGRQSAFFVAPEDGGEPARVWLVFGGNAARALDYLDLLPAIAAPGDGFLLVDYPGYGQCEGKPSPDSIAEATGGAMTACADHLGLATGALAKKAAVLGQSLGCAAGLMAAQRYGIREVVLLSPFTSMREMAARVVGRVFSFMVRHRYENRGPLKALLERDDSRIVILHGEADDVIPFEMGKELAAIDPERIEFHAVPGAGHNDLLDHVLPLLREVMR